MFLEVDVVIQAVQVQGWMVDIEKQRAVRGKTGVYPLDCGRVDVSSLQQSGHHNSGGGEVSGAFSITCLCDVATLSCCVPRLLEPLWMMILLREPSWTSVSSSRALSVVEHHI